MTGLRRSFYAVLFLRWLSTGFLVPILVLLMTDRGLSLGQVGLAWAVQAVVVAVLELPTGGLADALGRRTVLLAAALVALVAYGLLLGAGSLPAFALAYGLMGVYRALDSGPLEAWYVDAALAAEPDRDLERDLSGASVALYAGVASGALGAGLVGRLAEEPLSAAVTGAIVAQVVHLAAVAVLVRERRSGRGLRLALRAAGQAPRVVVTALRLAVNDPGLRLLLPVELFWGAGLSAFELFWQPRTAQFAPEGAGDTLIFGGLSAAGWVVGAAGAALLPLLLRLLTGRTTRAAALLRVVQGLAVACLALAGGLAAVVVGYLGFYLVHGASNAAHAALLHRRVDGAHRATVLSANSLASSGGFLSANLLLAPLADAAGLPVALGVAAVLTALPAGLYLAVGRVPARGVPAMVTG